MLSPHRTLVSEPLQKAGIATAAFHSNAYLCELFGWNRGWDVFYDSMDAEVTDEVPYIKGDGINAKVDAWLGARRRGAPFFLWVHYMDIHEPYVPPRKYRDPSLDMSDAEMFALFKQVLLARDVSNPDVVRTLRKLYDAHIRECDDYVRALFGILEKHGVLGDSVVIVTSDHGDEFGEHGGLSHDGKMVPELLDVPLLIVEPGRQQGESFEPLVSNIDIPPTILALFGIGPHEAFQGRSLLPLEAYQPRPCFAEAIGKRGREKETDRPVYCCRDADIRVVYDAAADSWELYDLASDPGQHRNIVASSSLAEEMKAKLRSRINRVR